jgi:hypothetical protein
VTLAEVLAAARAAGVTLWAEGDGLRYRGPREALTADFLDSLKVHKAELLASLAAAADALLWRVAIREPGRTIEVDAPSGWTLADWQAYADRYHGPGCTVMPIAGLPKPRAPVLLEEVLAAACDGVVGISPELFRSLLSLEDLEAFAEGSGAGRV